ncbi:MAG TPA: DUF4124 domain-containing protein [Rhodocyclaceae bacterium]|mgnify:FL=1|nr:DUF4124 domain-containing protein [Rhodocyclaceae bacterium]HNC62918.1 DUF4124 domain-containing protein [Rhodocyclaceae bacterium]HNH14707.1 DUF4124 domain-containing protein [Rhodocyclaceae bacterium]HNI00523.1 DUF4124 domain-containing protein [Rhodocyclaceae bacterium]
MKQKLLLAAIMASLAGATAAEVYRWVDQNGVVNYGTAPPAGVKASPLDPGKVRLSVVASPPRPDRPAEPGSADLRARISRLESQLEEERRLRALADAAEADRLARARTECEAQRRLNCETDPFGPQEAAILVHPVRRPIFFSHDAPGFHRRPTAPHATDEPRAVRRSVTRRIDR